ncbi:sulfatase [Planctomycetota bacterium]
MPDKPLNILLITSDQQHWNTLGCINPEIKTPNLDRLASRGTMFTRAYCPNPTCTPTRASMITGTYPSQHGAYSLGTKLPETEHTVGEDFQNAGYRTALVGKAHFQPTKSTPEFSSLESMGLLQDLDFWREFNEPFYGFEHVELARNHTDEHLVGQHYALWMEEKGLSSWRDHFRKPTGTSDRQQHTWSLPEEFHYNTWIAERTNALLDEYTSNGDPFFLWASFFDPHPSYLVSEPWDRMYDPGKITVPSIAEGEHEKNPPHFQMTQTEKPDFSIYQEEDGNYCHGLGSHLHDSKEQAKNIAVYYGMVSCMDKYIGTILDKLEELGLSDSTLIVFTTDHGHLFGQHGLIGKGAFHYEDLLRVPFIVSCPGIVPEGRSVESLVSLVDLPPTFLSFAGLQVPRTMTGIDQKEVWCGNRGEARDYVIVENRHQPTTLNLKTYVDKRYKITVYYNQAYGELFDLEQDPEEIHNLWDSPEHQSLKQELLLKYIHAELGKEPLPMPRIAGA